MADPLPSPPFITVPGVANFREVTGHNFRPNLVYRSADPTKAKDQGMKKMKDLGITQIYDLRSEPEILRDGPEWQGVSISPTDVFSPHGLTRHWTPVFSQKDYGPDKVALRYKDYTTGTQGFVNAYRDILQNAGPAYAEILRYLAGAGGREGVLVHCTAGKDRTGVFVALLWMLIGASPEVIADEYALTDLGLAELKPLFIERLLKNPALEGNREGVERMVGSRRENMLGAVEMIRDEFGGSREYMREVCGLEDGEIERLKRNLMVESSASS